MAGLTEKGFERKTREEILSDMQAAAKNLFGKDVNLADNSPLGIFLRLISYSLSLIWFAMEKVYNSSFVDFATDIHLDYVCKYIGIKRKEATKATGEVEFTGEEGVEIPVGFPVEAGDPEPIRFITTKSGIINETKTVTLPIEAEEAGEDGNVASGTITEIVEPMSGLDSVINNNPTGDEELGYKKGTERETDAELRERYKESTAKGGASTTESIRAALLEVEGIESAVVKENDKTTEQDGIPPKSVYSLVYGGTDNDIAQTIFDTKAGGIRAFGDIEVIITDSIGSEHTIGFSRPSVKEIYVDVDLVTDEDFPEDGVTQVENNIIEYIGGINSEEEEYTGLGIGEDVIYIRIIDAIADVGGVIDAEVTLGASENPDSKNNINIFSDEVAVTDNNKVNISLII